MSSSDYEMTDLLTLITAEGAEGLSLHTGERPMVHLGGEPHPIEGPPITPETADTLFQYLATPEQVRDLRERGTSDFIYAFQPSARFQVQAKLHDGQLQVELQRLWA